jgi:hypothetical protein
MHAEPPAIAPPSAPIDRDVPCPLCEYNLRGLTDPRCPECGYRFAWDELLDPARQVHPYLFEHHPKRNVWSFFKTLVGAQRPTRFWQARARDQPSRPRPCGRAGLEPASCSSQCPAGCSTTGRL